MGLYLSLGLLAGLPLYRGLVCYPDHPWRCDRCRAHLVLRRVVYASRNGGASGGVQIRFGIVVVGSRPGSNLLWIRIEQGLWFKKSRQTSATSGVAHLTVCPFYCKFSMRLDPRRGEALDDNPVRGACRVATAWADQVGTRGVLLRVLTYGTFDLFHYGHIRLLQRARSLGTRLVVGLSTDEFNAVKGKHAFMPYEERAELLMACRYVDEVFPERDWEQKAADISRLEADIFVMGDDWKGKFDHLGSLCTVAYLERTPLISSTLLREGLKSYEPQASEGVPVLSPAVSISVAKELEPLAGDPSDAERLTLGQAGRGGSMIREAAR